MDAQTSTTSFCENRVAPDSIYGLLHRECFALFPDEMFADLFTDVGRRCVPPMIVAVVMALQRSEGCSDREAVDRFAFDMRWKYAAGGLGFDYPSFSHTVLVDMRARLAASKRPDRIFEVVLEVAKQAGLIGRRRVLDSTALYDAVATMDTVTLIRSAIRGLLAACDAELEAELHGRLRREDDYRSAGKPVCDYDDKAARETLVDALAKDALALISALDGRDLSESQKLQQAAALVATVVGQDLDEHADGVFRIARRVAKDRVISIVDPEARHGHKTAARGFDGYKGHVAIDPDSELITATVVTAGNVGDGSVAEDLLVAELAEARASMPIAPEPAASEPAADEPAASELAASEPAASEPAASEPAASEPAASEPAASEPAAQPAADEPVMEVYGDASYGTGPVLETLESVSAEIMCKAQPPVAPGGRFAKDEFQIDLQAATVTCPAGQIVDLRGKKGRRVARFAGACHDCPLADRCTKSAAGRSIHVGPHEAQLVRARERQANPEWTADYRATRPKIERKIAHLMQRKHGGRRARVRGKPKVAADFSLLAAAANLARLAVLGLTHQTDGWVLNTA